MGHRFAPYCGFALAALAMAGAARAQDALGDGHALDASLSTRTRYNLGSQPFLLNRLNEAVVTGRAPGGYGFRGDPGYAAAREFRGNLGSDDIYDFQIDAFRSGLPLYGVEPYQHLQPGGTIAGGNVPGLRPPYVLEGPGSGVDLAELTQQRYGIGSVRISQPGSLGEFRTIRQADQEWRRDDAPSGLPRPGEALTRTDSTSTTSPYVVSTADPLLAPPSMRWYPGMGDPPAEEPVEVPGAPGLTEQWPTIESDQEAESEGAPASAVWGEDPYRDYMATLVAQREGLSMPRVGEPYSPELIEAMERFTQRLRGNGVGLTTLAPEADETDGDQDDGPGAPSTTGPVPAETFSQNLPPVESFAGDTQARFDRVMARAEDALAEERYFDAQRWFDVALVIRAGHPMASLGRVHAQLGAGLHRSAALNLRRLYEAHPELTAMRTAPALEPSPERLQVLIDELDRAVQGAAFPDAGLALAYLGRLNDDTEAIARGLHALTQAQPDDPIAALLRTAWLSEQ